MKMLENDGPAQNNPGFGESRAVHRRRLAICASVVILFVTLLTEQADAHVALGYPIGGEVFEVGSTVQITWSDVVEHGPADYDLWYSVTGPDGPWISIAGGLSRTGSVPESHDWLVPDTPSNQVRVRVRQNNVDSYYDAVSESDIAIVNSATVVPVELEPDRDATIYDDGDGTRANGSGSYLFAGRTAAQSGSAERRALLVFPIAEAVPEGAAIASVSLELMMSKTISGAQTVELHRLLEGWSEGPADPPQNEGGGASPSTGDVTWVHREYSDSLWMTSGGTFAIVASASLQVDGVGTYTFASTPELVADVQGWLDDPSSNFGWVMVVDSPPTGSAKRFNSRENSSASSRPKLTVSYQADPLQVVAAFSFSPANPQPGEGVQFSDESTGEPTSWFWDFGDGQTSDQQNPSHTYSTAGNVTVTLGASNSSSEDTAITTLRIGSSVRRPSRRVAPNP